LTTRPHWLLASLFRFQGATTRHRNARTTPSGRAAILERRADTHLCLHHSREGRGQREASVSIHPQKVLRADWRYYGLTPGSASRDGEFDDESGLVSAPMGSSGTKKSRKGGSRQHLAKVGSPAENSHTMHSAERDVVGNFGVGG